MTLTLTGSSDFESRFVGCIQVFLSGSIEIDLDPFFLGSSAFGFEVRICRRSVGSCVVSESICSASLLPRMDVSSEGAVQDCRFGKERLKSGASFATTVSSLDFLIKVVPSVFSVSGSFLF